MVSAPLDDAAWPGSNSINVWNGPVFVLLFREKEVVRPASKAWCESGIMRIVVVDRGSSVVVSYDVKSSRSVVVVIWEREVGDEGGHDKSNRGIP